MIAYTPAQQVALARNIQHAATLALAMHHGKEWNICNAVMEGDSSLGELLRDVNSPTRRVHLDYAATLASDLALFFDEAQLTALAQPLDPSHKMTLAGGKEIA